MTVNGISVIICCYNSELRIGATLNALQKQVNTQNIKWEVIVVDNASTDNTISIARQNWDEKNKSILKIVSETKKGLKFARIKGIESSQYDILSFIDDDNWVNENWIIKLNDIFSANENIAAAGGYSEAVFESSAPSWFGNFQKAFAVGNQFEHSGILNKGKTLWGAGLTLRKKHWLKLFKSGFEYRLTGRKGKELSAGEDTELCLALQIAGFELWYDTELGMKHFMTDSRLSYSKLIEMNRGFGKAEVILRIYRAHFDESVHLHDTWIKELFATMFFYLKLVIFKKFKGSSDTEMSKAFALGYLEQLKLMKSKYETIQNEIKVFCKEVQKAG